MFSRGSSSSGGAADAVKLDQIKSELTMQLAAANAQELVNKINEKCYARCVTSPSTSLTPREQKALTNCTDRYLEAYNIISRTYVDRVTKERGAAAAAASSAPEVAALGSGLSTEGFR